MVTVLFINNDGAGFADYVQVESRTTVMDFFKAKMGDSSPSNFLIRVNRLPVPSDYELQDKDRVTMTPTKIQGAL